MGKCKAKAIHANVGIFTHIPAHSGIIRHIQELFRHIQAYSEPFVTLGYGAPWYIQNPSIFRSLSNIYDEAFCENS